MACRLYPQNAAAPYSPATLRGAWDKTSGYVDKKLGRNKSGVNASSGINENSATNNFDVLLGRFVSDALPADITINGTVQWTIGTRENNNAANDRYHVHIYVTTGDSDTPRGTLLTDDIGGIEWITTATAINEGLKSVSSVSAQAGDRIVFEIGYQAQNTVTTAYTGTISYGGTGNDLAHGETTVTVNCGWIEFSDNIFGSEYQHKVKPKAVDLIHNDLTNKLILDLPIVETGGTVIRDTVRKRNASVTGTLGTNSQWVKSPWGSALDVMTATGGGGITDDASLNIGALTTFECIFKMDTMPTSTKSWFSYLFTDEDNVQAPQALTAVWRVGSAGTQANSCYLGINFYDSSNHDTVSNNRSLVAGEWYHVFFVTDGTNVKFYINGKLDSTVAFAITPTNAAYAWNIGRWLNTGTGGGRALDGQIALIRLWNRDLKPQEIGKLYADPWTIYKKPSAWWLGKAAAAGATAVKDLIGGTGFIPFAR